MDWACVIGASFLLGAASASAQLISVQLEYPPAELRAGIQGTVGFEVTLSKRGKVTGCNVTQSSGNANLDQQTCVQLRRTAQFRPATDASRKPIASTYSDRLRWTIPPATPATQPSAPTP